MGTIQFTWIHDWKIDNILRCDVCGNTSKLNEIARHTYTCEVTGNPVTSIFSSCPICNYPILGLSYIKHFHKSKSDPNIYEAEYDYKRVYPTTRDASYAFPDDIRAIFDEAIKCYESKLFVPAIIMCRKTLEAVCKYFEPDTKNLYQGLKKLCELGKIEKKQLVWADSLRKAGNFHTHEPNTKDTAERDSFTVLNFTEAILVHIFDLSERYKRELKGIGIRNNKENTPA